MRWALVVGGVVVNVAIWDGVREWDHGADAAVLLEGPGSDLVGVGWSWDGSAFASPEAGAS
jgi:hypothetical protein